ncbi:Mini-ribonuclease 3 [Salirhabdus salicampi]|uniref:Mini-ribonuclease 3 n=1 Tax=Salirhabdus salicampi TaxID=476102 RepID=UPI0020C4C341|nr:ribonuclease III domain-containing protein [Salirhabdus salicampi]MCP8618066.1 ribonuclease III [Salirhabdus salicampi]
MNHNLDVKQLKSLALAYMGDAAYEIHVREYLLRQGIVNPNALHRQAVKFVTASSQAKALRKWQETGMLTDEEEGIVRRGRNAKSNSAPKHTDVITYKMSTAFEALLGYHYLCKNEDRLEELLIDAVRITEERG